MADRIHSSSMGHYDAKTGSKSQGIASEALQVQAPAGSPDASGETLDTTPGSIMSFTRALPGEKALASLALQVKKSGVSRENHTPPACLTPTILSSLAASIPGPTAHLVEILQVGGEMNVPGAGRVSPEQERKLASIALNIPSTLHLSSRKLTAEAAGDLARAFTTPRPEKIIGTLARISQDLLREKIVSDSDRKALLEWVATTVDGIPGRTDQQDCSAYLMWNIAHIGLNAGCTAKAMESFLDLLASQSSGALGGILAGKAIEFDTSISDEDERCLVQLRVFQAIGHNQNKLFTWLETNLACNAEFQGHQAGMTAHRSLEYFKPLLEILAHPPSNPPAATIARAVLDGTAHWTDLDHIMNAQWGTFCENVKGSFCTPYEKALSWLGYSIVDSQFNREHEGTWKKDREYGDQILQALAAPPDTFFTYAIAEMCCTRADRTTFNKMNEILDRGFTAILADPHAATVHHMVARRGLDEKNGTEKLNIMKSLNQAAIERERAQLMEAAGRLAAQGGPETQVLEEDEQYIVIDGIKLKRAPG